MRAHPAGRLDRVLYVPWCTSKCRCGPVEWPVEPSLPICWPAVDLLADRHDDRGHVPVVGEVAVAVVDQHGVAVALGGPGRPRHDVPAPAAWIWVPSGAARSTPACRRPQRWPKHEVVAASGSGLTHSPATRRRTLRAGRPGADEPGPAGRCSGVAGAAWRLAGWRRRQRRGRGGAARAVAAALGARRRRRRPGGRAWREAAVAETADTPAGRARGPVVAAATIGARRGAVVLVTRPRRRRRPGRRPPRGGPSRRTGALGARWLCSGVVRRWRPRTSGWLDAARRVDPPGLGGPTPAWSALPGGS